MDASKDYYAVLGVDASASQDEIKRAFREQAKRCHPDRHPGDAKAAARFRQINAAYQVIGDAKERRRYDQLRMLGVGFHPDIEYGYDLHDLKERVAAGMSSVKDWFGGLFDGPEREDGPEPEAGAGKGRRGRDVTYKVSISLEKALEGGKATFSVPKLRGGGRRRLNVTIPAGIGEGKKIRLSGQGHPGAGGGEAGDLFLKVHILPHPDYERRDGKLVTTKRIDLRTMMLGGSIEIPRPLGGTAEVSVPPCSPPGMVLPAGDDLPDVEVRLELDLPETLDEAAQARFREFCDAAGIGRDG